MAKTEHDPVVRTALGLDEIPGDLGGKGTDDKMDSVGAMFHQAEYGLAPTSSRTVATPVKKSLTADELERELARRKRERLIKMGQDLLVSSRPLIRAAIIADLVIDRPEFADKLRGMK